MRFRISVLLALCLCIAVFPVALQAQPADEAAYRAEIEKWRQARHDRLADDNGWLTLVGLEWLVEGENTVGSAEVNAARIPGGPDAWGVIDVEGDTIMFSPAAESEVTVDGKSVQKIRLIADNQGKPTVVRHGDISFYVIFRESYALRIKDRKAPGLLAFHGVPQYAIQPDWLIEGDFVRAEEGTTIGIADVLGHTSDSPVYGTFQFERDGQFHRLLALGTEESQSLWFLLADKTSGRETYGAGRFLYSEGMPENGRLLVDFNKTYNPPCAFNDYSTCPLPPQQNRLRLAITAGEKKYHD
jgi:uncharacterized protein (DUF1684 family)